MYATIKLRRICFRLSRIDDSELGNVHELNKSAAHEIVVN